MLQGKLSASSKIFTISISGVVDSTTYTRIRSGFTHPEVVLLTFLCLSVQKRFDKKIPDVESSSNSGSNSDSNSDSNSGSNSGFIFKLVFSIFSNLVKFSFLVGIHYFQVGLYPTSIIYPPEAKKNVVYDCIFYVFNMFLSSILIEIPHLES